MNDPNTSPPAGPVCLACGSSDEVEKVSVISSRRGLHAEFYLCKEHVVLFSWHAGKLMSALLQGRLSMP